MSFDILLSEFLFWLGFFAINFSLFAYYYVVNCKSADFFPFAKLWKTGKIGLYMSHNQDFFRLSLDVSLLILLGRFKVISLNYTLLSCYFLFVLLYNVYHYSFLTLYQIQPVMLNDGKLIRNGIAFLWNESRIKMSTYFLFGVIGVIVCCFCFYAFINWSFALEINFLSHFGAFILACYFTLGILKKRFFSVRDTSQRILFFPIRFVRNVSYSVKLFLDNKKIHELLKRQSPSFSLITKPNVYVLFVESYGSLLVKDVDIMGKYLESIDSFQCDLRDSEWYMKSNLSESISLIGPSWLAYTSVLSGIRVDNNFLYEYLLNNESLHDYYTMMKVFQKKGYSTYNLNASTPVSGILIPFKKMSSFYGIDKWILKNDINFKGTNYGIMQSAPDQYVLNYAYDEILNKSSGANLLFYLTKNSHSPFVSPKKISKNWKDLNTGKEELVGNTFLQKPTLHDYFDSIKYQLDMLKDFILNKGKKDDIFLIIGDHQPHGLAKLDKHGKETIVHVISKNRKFVNDFDAYGFKDDILDIKSSIKHEAIFSMFLKEFVRNYGTNYDKLPDYEPEGIKL